MDVIHPPALNTVKMQRTHIGISSLTFQVFPIPPAAQKTLLSPTSHPSTSPISCTFEIHHKLPLLPTLIAATCTKRYRFPFSELPEVLAHGSPCSHSCSPAVSSSNTNWWGPFETVPYTPLPRTPVLAQLTGHRTQSLYQGQAFHNPDPPTHVLQPCRFLAS